MLARMDAARQCKRLAPLLLITLGCSTFAKREPAPGQPTGRIAPVKTSEAMPSGRLPNVQDLAITTPARSIPESEIQLAALRVPQPESPAPGGGESDPLRRLYRDAATSYAKLPCYIARLRRREVVQGRPRPEEVLVFKFREKPYSVHFKWLGEEGQGREVIYVRGQGDDKLHILTAAGDIPFTPAGRRLALAPDSLLVRSASRYPITEAGIGNMIGRFGRLVESVRTNEAGVQMKFVGPIQRPEYAAPLECVEGNFGPNHEPEIPNGGRRLMFFDPATHFPVVSVTYDLAGREVDYYCFDRFQLDVKLDDEDFNSEKLWGPPKK